MNGRFKCLHLFQISTKNPFNSQKAKTMYWNGLSTLTLEGIFSLNMIHCNFLLKQ